MCRSLAEIIALSTARQLVRCHGNEMTLYHYSLIIINPTVPGVLSFTARAKTPTYQFKILKKFRNDCVLL
jgi:hypothetical protein